MKALGKLNPLLVGALVLALVAALVVVFFPRGEKKYVIAEFPRTVSLYEGSDVKILGVPVGRVDTVKPTGTTVQVKFHYDGKYDVPANAKALVISPSVVGDRFVQLTPAYSGGATMANNARLGVDRTATPLELDEIFSSLNDLNIALGPDGANASDAGGVGPLTRLLDSTARNFGGQGVQFNKTLKDLGAFTKTLSDNKDELFDTLGQVEDFTSTLSKNDSTVRRFNDSLAAGADLLADERQELAAVLRNLSTAMVQVRSFVKDNRASLTRNVSGLNKISKTLVKRRGELDEILRTAPAALNNLFLAGNVRNGTLDVRDNLTEVFSQLQDNPAETLCTLVGQANNDGKTCSLIKQIFDNAPLPRTAALGQGKASSRGYGAASRLPAQQPEPVDPTMGGLLEVQR